MGYFTSYSQVASVLQKNYATEEVLVETKSYITHFVHMSNMTHSQHAEELMAKILWSGDVHEKNAHIDIFMNGLDHSVRHSLHAYKCNKKGANL